ncbi:MAG: hypothetical protein IPK26_23115 [Planctomycetes bacterium]|nr:hypothetical protein [Planctomycetota bacterium]
MKSVAMLASVGILCSGCGGNADARARLDAAVAAFTSFQQALRDGDAERCRNLLTDESQPVVLEMDWTAMRSKPPIAVHAAEAAGSAIYVRGEDPADGRTATFVVVKERGRFVVDLVATAAFYARETGPAKYGLEPAPLTPRDHDRLRQKQLAEPPR